MPEVLVQIKNPFQTYKSFQCIHREAHPNDSEAGSGILHSHKPRASDKVRICVFTQVEVGWKWGGSGGKTLNFDRHRRQKRICVG